MYSYRESNCQNCFILSSGKESTLKGNVKPCFLGKIKCMTFDTSNLKGQNICFEITVV